MVTPSNDNQALRKESHISTADLRHLPHPVREPSPPLPPSAHWAAQIARIVATKTAESSDPPETPPA